MNKPNDHIRTIADSYCMAHGFDTPVRGHYVPVNEHIARAIADTYEDLPTVDYSPECALAYTMLGREIEQQYQFAVHMGITFTPWTKDGQPYANSSELCDDIRSNKRLYFFTGGEVHPFLGVIGQDGLSLNDKFRAVHDLFGHVAEGYQFGKRGEENAWIHHSMMFTPEAQKALTTETRGQNSWVNYGPHSHLPASERQYAEQKCALLPEVFTNWRLALERD